MININGKVIVVTGGAGLLGSAFVKGILDKNGIAIIADYDNDSGVKLKEELSKNYKERVDFFKLDITSTKSVVDLIDYLDEKYSHINALVNNAYPRNKNYGHSFFDVTYKDFTDNVSKNLGGYFLCAQQFANYFMKQKEGNIINISSIYGIIAPRFEIYKETDMTTPVEYAAIKSGIIHLTKYMAKYFKGDNIRVNSISLGGIFNKQPDRFIQKYNSMCLNKGMLNPKDTIGTLIFLLSENCKYINGQNIIIDDGFTL